MEMINSRIKKKREVYPAKIKFQNYWKRFEPDALSPDAQICSEYHVDSEPIYNENLYQRTFLVYAHRLMGLLFPSVKEAPFALACFDANGVLRKLLGSEQILSVLATDNIKEHDTWELNKIGPNAVTVGMAEKEMLFTVGADNYNNLLKKYAIYYAPITMLESPYYTRILNMGGIAFFLPQKSHSSSYLTLLSLMSHDLILNLHTCQLAYRLYDRTNKSVLIIDDWMNEESSTIAYCNKQFFFNFGLPYQDYSFQPADQLIDPLPANKQFWSIIKEKRLLEETEIVLTIHGKNYPCTLSMDPLIQPSMKFACMNLFITTRQAISRSVAKQMGTHARVTFDDIMGESPLIKECIKMGKKCALLDGNLLILGESGTGKDVFAQAIHNGGLRRNKPFVAINCGAIPRDLIASELFGYEEGAFTGAKRAGNIGKFELANGGTIFLDEIGELPLEQQAYLLRIVETKQITRLGSNQPMDIDVRIVCATNANLTALINRRLFREDLFYRLSTLRLYIPPLRKRGRDIILLTDFFAQVFSQRALRQRAPIFSEAAKELLMQLPWNGNVRELQNLIENVVSLSENAVIEPGDINAFYMYSLKHSEEVEQTAMPFTTKPDHDSNHVQKRPTESEILAALERCGGNRSKAAQLLGIPRRTFYRRLKEYNM